MEIARSGKSRQLGFRAALSITLALVLAASGAPIAAAEERAASEDATALPATSEQPAPGDSQEPVSDAQLQDAQVPELPARISVDVELEAPTDQATAETDSDDKGNADEAPASDSQTTAEVPLAKDEAKPAAGTLVFDGLEYQLNPDGTTVAMTGFYGKPSSPDVVIPSAIKTGGDVYAVTIVKVRGGAHILALLR